MVAKTLPIIAGTIMVPIFVFGYFIGSAGVIIAFSIAGLLIYGSGCFAAGAYWTERTFKQGANIVITSTSRNDKYDTRKIEAMAKLAETSIRSFAKGQNQAIKNPPLQIPAFTVEEGVFDELD